jgi:ABC-type transport system involved in cytochrome c biogenesis permease subunit
MTFPTLLSYWSGLAFVSPDLDPATIVGTALVVHVCDAIMCRLFAHNNGYPKTLWTLLGFVGGLWAVAVLVLLPRRDRRATS